MWISITKLSIIDKDVDQHLKLNITDNDVGRYHKDYYYQIKVWFDIIKLSIRNKNVARYHTDKQQKQI